VKSFVTCEGCKSDGFWERQRAECAACGRKKWLCPTCWAIYTTCSPECQAKWREKNKGVFDEPLKGSSKRQRKRKDVGQGDLFGDSLRVVRGEEGPG